MMLWIARVGLLCIVLGWVLAFVKGVRAHYKRRWVLDTSSDKAPDGLPVSIVIPARNEERGIGACVLSALSQDHPNVEVIVLNDGSTDRTGAILEEIQQQYKRLKLPESDGESLPEGWFGKPWALQRAQRYATGRWLLFIDADVVLEPEAVSRTVEYARQNKLDMVTGLGTLEMESLWERVMQPVVGGLILAGNSLSSVNNPDKKDSNLANGQFILVSRDAYDEIGRHASVQKNILDDVGIARALVEHDKLYHCLYLDDLFRCRMYTSFSEIWEGWTKNLFAGLRYSIPNLILALLFTFAFSILGHVLFALGALRLLDVHLISLEFMIWGTAIMVMTQLTRGLMDHRRGMNLLYGLTHAPANILVLLLLINSARRSLGGTVTWKGRVYKPTK